MRTRVIHGTLERCRSVACRSFRYLKRAGDSECCDHEDREWPRDVRLFQNVIEEQHWQKPHTSDRSGNPDAPCAGMPSRNGGHLSAEREKVKEQQNDCGPSELRPQ